MDAHMRADAKLLREQTLSTLKQVDENLWIMQYRCDYGLRELLQAGSKDLLGTVRFLQRQVDYPFLFPDPFKQAGGCSAFSVVNEAGEPLMGRNFDYKQAPVLVVWTAPEDGYKSVAAVDHTMMLHGMKHLTLGGAKKPMRVLVAPYASMDGVNEKGLACAILQIKAKPTKQNTGKTPIMTSVALRAALDTCATVEEAIRLFSSYDMHDLLGVAYHYAFADASGDSAVVEYVDNEMHVLRQETPYDPLVATNYFLTPGGDNTKGKGWDRYERICKAYCDAGGVMSETAAMDLLSRNRLYYHHKTLPHMVTTLWSEVFNCAAGSMLMCAGMDYSKPYRFYADRPGEIEQLPCIRRECRG